MTIAKLITVSPPDNPGEIDVINFQMRLINVVLDVIAQLIVETGYTEFNLMFSQSWARVLDDEYIGVPFPYETTLRQRIERISTIQRVELNRYLPPGAILLVNNSVEFQRAVTVLREKIQVEGAYYLYRTSRLTMTGEYNQGFELTMLGLPDPKGNPPPSGPDDARLIYADWQEDRGHGEFAAWLRDTEKWRLRYSAWQMVRTSNLYPGKTLVELVNSINSWSTFLRVMEDTRKLFEHSASVELYRQALADAEANLRRRETQTFDLPPKRWETNPITRFAQSLIQKFRRKK